MKWLALLVILLLVPSAFATSVTVDIFGTNVSNAQSNITQTGNNSYQIVQWAVGDTTKTLKADINGNASDDITFTIHNLTVSRVVEVKVNSSSYNSYQADSAGTISFTRTQTVRNQTYSFSPAVNAGGYNFTWAQFWTYPFIQGTNLSTIITNLIINYNYLPYTGATADLDMNNKNITNVRTLNVTTTNVTILNATNIQGNGSGISNINASNLTNPLAAVNASALFGLNMSNQTRCTGNATCTYHANGSVSFDALSNTTGMFNQILNSSTVTVRRNANGTLQFDAEYFNFTSGTVYSKIGSLAYAGDASSMINPGSNIFYTRFLANISGNITNLSVNLNTGGGNTISTAVYSDNATGYPGTLLGQSEALATAGGWLNTTYNSSNLISVVKGTQYWVAFHSPSSLGTALYTKNVSAGINTSKIQTTAYGAFPATATPANYTEELNIRVPIRIDEYVETWLTTVIIENINQTSRSLNTAYWNTNIKKSLMVFATVRCQVTSASGQCLFWGASGSNRLSETVGIENGLLNQETTQQVVFIVYPNSAWAINTTTSTGTATLRGVREVTI